MSKLEYDLENFVRLCHLHDKVAKLEQALAEKDREIEYLQECRISAAAMDAQRIIEYQQLMEKAVRFAETLVNLHEFCDIEASDIEASTFLGSPQVQAWKEQP